MGRDAALPPHKNVFTLFLVSIKIGKGANHSENRSLGIKVPGEHSIITVDKWFSIVKSISVNSPL